MKKFDLFCIVLVLMFVITGCLFSFVKKEPVCERPGAENSIICKVLTDRGINVNDVNLLFKVVNVTLIKKDAYTKEEFLKFIDEVEGLITVSSTYENLSAYLLDAVNNFNENYKIEMVLLADYFDDFDMVVNISDFDRDLLLEHIKQQRDIVSLM
jgi:hypothetical protein